MIQEKRHGSLISNLMQFVKRKQHCLSPWIQRINGNANSDLAEVKVDDINVRFHTDKSKHLDSFAQDKL